MRALFLTPQFNFYKEIPDKVLLYQIAFFEKLTKVDHDDTRAIVPTPKMYIMQFQLRDPIHPNPFGEKPTTLIYEYIGIKENYDR